MTTGISLVIQSAFSLNRFKDRPIPISDREKKTGRCKDTGPKHIRGEGDKRVDATEEEDNGTSRSISDDHLPGWLIRQPPIAIA
jgi:hypothetical protein